MVSSRAGEPGLFIRSFECHAAGGGASRGILKGLPMDLAKPRIDFGLTTDNIEPMLRSWQDEVGLPFDHLLKIRRGHDQHRHDALGSVIKINHTETPPHEGPPTGYRELYIAREGLAAPRPMVDPDGNRVPLVPPGWRGIG